MSMDKKMVFEIDQNIESTSNEVILHMEYLKDYIDSNSIQYFITN